LIYLKFASGMDASRKELLARWMAPAGADAPAAAPRKTDGEGRPAAPKKPEVAVRPVPRSAGAATGEAG